MSENTSPDSGFESPSNLAATVRRLHDQAICQQATMAGLIVTTEIAVEDMQELGQLAKETSEVMERNTAALRKLLADMQDLSNPS